MANQSIENIESQLRQFRRAEPFVAFEVVLDSGQKYQVRDRFHFAWDGYKMLVITPQGVQTFRVERIADVHEIHSH